MIEITETLKNVLQRLGWHINRNQQIHLHQVREDLISLHLLPDIDLQYIPWTDAALTPSAVRTLLNEVIFHDRRRVIEFGCGISTLYLATHFSNQNASGKVISVEEDKNWREIVRGYLDEMDVSDECWEIIEAPLHSGTLNESTTEWYNASVLHEELPDETFDVVLVDGPVAYKDNRERVRYPAFPFIEPYLDDDFAVFLDDIAREGEQKIAKQWGSEYDITYDTQAGMAVFRPASTNGAYSI